MALDHDTGFRAMGCDVRLLIGERTRAGGRTAAAAAAGARAYIERFAARLTRFDASSELCALNADPRSEVPASALLRAAVRAGLWAAERTGGLVDPTLVGALERAGYASSRERAERVPVADALHWAPERRPAAPDPAARWREVEVDDETGTIRRPPGLRLDTGGTGKGLAADAVAHRLYDFSRIAIDCGGDIAVRGPGTLLHPYEVGVEHPLTGDTAHRVVVAHGGVATSGLNIRVWRRVGGSFAHHLIDPSTGAPAWTGLTSATALGGSALEAETLSKQALLLGPDGARTVLAERGGVLVHDSGDVELVGPVSGRPRVTFRLPERVAG
jgi:thiamine biosynthesis lipoprotein